MSDPVGVESRPRGSRVSDCPTTHNLEAERSVLGAILLHDEVFGVGVDVISPDDLFRDAHRRIFSKMNDSGPG